MIIKPGILRDTKYQMLRSSLGGPVAMEVLISLWGHVEVASGDHSDLILDDAEAIAGICNYRGNAKKLKEALMEVPFGREAGFLSKSEVVGMLRVHGWMEKNAGLVQRRVAGKQGGRPPKPDGNRMETGRLSSGITGEEPDRNRVEKSRVEESIPPNPREWVSEFLEGLKGTGKFPALTLEMLMEVMRGYPGAELEKRWRVIKLEAASLPGGVVSAPLPWLRKAISRLEVSLIGGGSGHGEFPKKNRGETDWAEA